MKNLILLNLIMILLFSCQEEKKAIEPEVQKPNIIYILADDLGYGDLSCYGSNRINTPNIDKMASEGLKFTQFYAGSAVCTPTRV
ncbi:MAG: sulfatase-like hydrolase/transferase, partial [Maribacter arcticus]|uniref:sulfatase-like hydrolase/transferase n=1 Tax=Maribacter arcticus TaxID=561365 RepID=UPI003002B7D6